MASGPDELYTLRAQYWLGHYASALQEAKQVARRPMSAALKEEREEYQMKAYLALRQYDKCVAAPGDSTGLQAIALKAQYEAAEGDANKQKGILDQLKTLAGTGEPGPAAQLAAAQVCLAAGETSAAYPFVSAGTTVEHRACKVQILLKLDRLDLAKSELTNMRKLDGDEDSVLSELCNVYIYLYEGSSQASEAEHTLNALSEQYGPSVYLLNLLGTALALQGDFAASETKLLESLRDFSEIQPQHETMINLITIYQQQGKVAEAGQMVEEIFKTTTPTSSSVQFIENLSRVTNAFDREATKYKV